jgi:uncharacterized protein (TIGR02569 family)
MNAPTESDSRPPSTVLQAFDVAQHGLRPLRGGTDLAWRAGHAVLKPCYNPVEWRWLANQLPGVRQDGFRLALPLPARDGRWVVEGWCAQTAVEGAHGQGRWLDVLAVGERFHAAIAHLERPTFLDARDNPWSVGDRVAWEEIPSPFDHPSLRRMLDLRRPIHLDAQLIHGDLGGNVLFAEGLPPAVIDVAPYWRPVGFAAAVVVADAVCWEGAPPEIFDEVAAEIDRFPQLFVRALIYRLVTSLEFYGTQIDLSGYAPAIEMAQAWVASDEDERVPRRVPRSLEEISAAIWQDLVDSPAAKEATAAFYTVEGHRHYQKEEEIKARLSGPIKEILACELAAGNQIVVASDDWPTQKANILLKDRFAKDYRTLYPNLQYTFDNDPHYWRDAYLDEENQEFIAVRHSLSHLVDSAT